MIHKKIKSLNKSTLISIILFASLTCVGCVQMGLMVGNLLTSKTADLSVVACQVRYTKNLYTPLAKTTEAKYMPEAWIEGANLVVVSFFKREGTGFWQIDGKVFIDGKEVSHIANGNYALTIPKYDVSPKKVRVETKTGESFEVEINPIAPIKLISVNGKQESAEINLNSDLTL